MTVLEAEFEVVGHCGMMSEFGQEGRPVARRFVLRARNNSVKISLSEIFGVKAQSAFSPRAIISQTATSAPCHHGVELRIQSPHSDFLLQRAPQI